MAFNQSKQHFIDLNVWIKRGDLVTCIVRYFNHEYKYWYWWITLTAEAFRQILLKVVLPIYLQFKQKQHLTEQ
jgi:hypothetical protein